MSIIVIYAFLFQIYASAYSVSNTVLPLSIVPIPQIDIKTYIFPDSI